ncbi:MAG: recombination protein RecR [Acidobacteria bacterium]|nr:MAG: recombination protein RecR [Acidobacteriota bacterium]
MRDYAAPLETLIEEFKKLPGIGSKSAQRLAFHIIRTSRNEAEKLAQAILQLKEAIHYCSICNNITDVDPCRYCTDPSRDRSMICVLEEPHNLISIEKTREYHGLYHVLLGVLSPLQGIGPDQLKIKGLMDRVKTGEVKEIILATNPNVEGEATALYLSKLIKPLEIRVTRIAMGVPVGGDLDYADDVTVSKALEGRRDF